MTIEEWRSTAVEILSAAWGVRISCTRSEVLSERDRNSVYRLAVEGGPAPSVILKAFTSANGNPYAAGDHTPGSAFARLCNEWAGAQLLGPLGLGPSAYGGEPIRGVCLLEDLGDGESLADRLTGRDSEAAASALLAYARSLGDMHAATSGESARWDRLLTDLGGRVAGRGPLATPWEVAAERAPALLVQMDIAPSADLNGDLAKIGDALERPGAYLAFTPSDCCPDNHLLRGDRVVFFDCESATMRHALLDAAYFFAPFPTCWCCAALPEEMPERMLAAYREGFGGGPDFEDQLTLMLAAWLVQGLSTWRMDDVGFTQLDAPWGLSTIRQRVVALLGHLLARPNFEALTPSLADAVSRLDRTWRDEWATLAPMPMYPAFR